MRSKMRQIIAEELHRIMEGEVIRPSFGGRKSESEPPKKTPFEEALTQIEATIINILNEDDHKHDTDPADRENKMSPEELTYLDKMLEQIHKTQQRLKPRTPRRRSERPFGAEPTESERSELERFKAFMHDYDRDGDY